MRFAWSKLFATRHVSSSPSLVAEIAAIRAGKKAMSVFAYEDYDAIARRARDLVIVVQQSRGEPEPSVFVTKPNQLWRIPAWLALRETAFTDGPWSNAAEAQTSLLLGYSAKQRAAWIADAKHRHAAWGSGTIYTLVTPAQKRRLTALGNRCFDALAGAELAFDRTGNGLVARAIDRVPRGVTLARVALGWSAFGKLFGRLTTPSGGVTPPLSISGGRVAVATVPQRLESTINAALQSNILFLSGRGWR